LESALAKELSDAVGAQNVISIEGLLGIEPAGPPKLGTAFVTDGKRQWVLIIRKFAELESKLPFVGLKLARDRYGFGQEIIDEGISSGIFQTYPVPNPGQAYTTTALRLDRNHAAVKETLAE